MKNLALFASLVGLLLAHDVRAEDPLVLDSKIALGNVSGRIDHFAFDEDRQLLFVAELGNGSVGIVDLKEGKVLRRLTGLREPQGVAWHAGTKTLYVANAGDGVVRLFQGPDFIPAGALLLKNDADNIRLDTRRDRVVVGYGGGGLAVFNPNNRAKVADLLLRGHPESFQFDPSGARIFVNVPDVHEIAVLNADTGLQTSSLDTAGARSNFPMTVDAERHRVLVVFRSPSKLAVFASDSGKPVAHVETCRDADDLFVDAKRHRVYVSCGEGVIDVFAESDDGYQRLARLPTVAGARTSYFSATTDRLYLGVRASGAEPAGIWVLRPAP